MDKGMIRYRIWDGEKMWYPGTDWSDGGYMVNGEGTICQYRESVGPTSLETYIAEYDEDDGYVAMLSTGLKDKTGKEVWVGDIVEFDPEEDGNIIRAEVLLWPGKFILYESPERVYEIGEVGDGEVVGNLHE